MERKIIITGIIIAGLLLLFGCDTGSGGTTPVTYEIGATGPAGGLIFCIDEEDNYSWTYLEVAPISTEWTLKPWGGYGTEVPDADGTAIGTGAQNTIDIVTEYGDMEPYDDATDYAAKLCSDMVYGGYDDWFLPSKDELDAIWINLVEDPAGANSGVGGFAQRSYWSSSEDDSNFAWAQDFKDGDQFSYFKTGLLGVRAVRAF